MSGENHLPTSHEASSEASAAAIGVPDLPISHVSAAPAVQVPAPSIEEEENNKKINA